MTESYNFYYSNKIGNILMNYEVYKHISFNDTLANNVAHLKFMGTVCPRELLANETVMKFFKIYIADLKNQIVNQMFIED